MKISQDAMLAAASNYLDYLSTRQRVIASNLANIDTPGFHVKDLTFKRELIAASGQELPGSTLMTSRPTSFEVEEVPGLEEKGDGNNVNLDREMTQLSETQIKYNMMVQMLTRKFRILHMAASDGRQG